MMPKGQNADASFYYHEDATADVASMNSSAVYGNLADAMKNSVVVVTDKSILDLELVDASHEDDGTTGHRPFHREES